MLFNFGFLLVESSILGMIFSGIVYAAIRISWLFLLGLIPWLGLCLIIADRFIKFN